MGTLPISNIVAGDDLPLEVANWIREKLQLFRVSHGHGMLELYIQDGYIYSYRDSYYHHAKGRERSRSRSPKNK